MPLNVDQAALEVVMGSGDISIYSVRAQNKGVSSEVPEGAVNCIVLVPQTPRPVGTYGYQDDAEAMKAFEQTVNGGPGALLRFTSLASLATFKSKVDEMFHLWLRRAAAEGSQESQDAIARIAEEDTKEDSQEV